MKVVLFDIDGTLLWTDGAGRRAVNRAIEEVFGVTPATAHEFDGKTDPLIVRELMRLAGVSDETIEANLQPTLARYVELLHEELGKTDCRDMTFVGVGPLLDALEARDDVLLGLLTGNVREGAVAKLTAVGLDHHRFQLGAYGSDHGSRPELPAIARKRAEERLGTVVRGEDVVVIGDTPADMSCGNGIGARAIGVATGRYSVEQLLTCQPAAAFADFADTAGVVKAIMGES